MNVIVLTALIVSASTIHPRYPHDDEHYSSAGAIIVATIAGIATATGVYCMYQWLNPSNQSIMDKAHDNLRNAQNYLNTTGGFYDYNGNNEEHLKIIGETLHRSKHTRVASLIASLDSLITQMKQDVATITDRLANLEKRNDNYTQVAIKSDMKVLLDKMQQTLSLLTQRKNLIAAHQDFFVLHNKLFELSAKYDDSCTNMYHEQTLQACILKSHGKEKFPYLKFTDQLGSDIASLSNAYQETKQHAPWWHINAHTANYLTALQELHTTILQSATYRKALDDKRAWDQEQEKIRIEQQKANAASREAQAKEEKVRLERERNRMEQEKIRIEKEKLKLEKEKFAQEQAQKQKPYNSNYYPQQPSAPYWRQ